MGGRAGGGAGMGSGSRGGAIGRMANDYLSGVDSDFNYTAPGGAVGQLLGSTPDEVLGGLKETLGGIKNVKTVTDLNKFSNDVDKAFIKANKTISEKQSLLEHNFNHSSGARKNTHQKALNELSDLSYTVYSASKKGYGSGKLIALNEFLIKNGKW